MISRVAALAVVLGATLLPSPVAAGGDAHLYVRWLAESQAAVARIRDPKQRAAAQQALEATLARMQTERAAPGPRLDPRLAAQSELANKRYRLENVRVRPQGKSWWQNFWDWVGQRWDALRDAIFRRIRLGPAGQVAVGDALIAVVAALLLFAVFRLLVNLQIVRSRRAISVRALDAPRSAHALYLQACAAARDGRFAEAVRTLFLATVVALDLRGIVRENASATVNELRSELRSRDAQMVAPYDDVARSFVAAAYAEQPVAQTDWERAADAYRRLVRAESAA